jgi:polyhydroxyalkanoate synthesis regulator phasin
MADFDLFKNALDAGMAFTQMTRQRAEAIVNDFVRNGEASREQAAEWVEELVDRSRKNTDLLLSIVRQEIDARLAQLATRDDLAKLARRVEDAFRGGGLDRVRMAAKRTATTARRTASKRPGAAKKTAAKKTAAKKAPAKKTTAKKTAAKKTAAKKAPAKKAPAKKTAG